MMLLQQGPSTHAMDLDLVQQDHTGDATVRLVH